MWLIALALADGPTPDVQVEWTEPTCADDALLASVTKRLSAVCGGGKAEQITYQYRESSSTGCVVWAHAVCAGAPPVAWAPPGAVVRPTLYDDTGFRKLALSLGEGQYDLGSIPQREGGNWNRKAGSVRVPSGWTVRLCADGDASRCTDLTGDTTDLGNTYVGNDRARYVTVARGAATSEACPRGFEHDGFGGRTLEICGDMPDLRSSQWDNVLSSVLVPAGWVVKLCDGVDGVTPCTEIASDTRRLGDTLVGADRASSIFVVKRPGR